MPSQVDPVSALNLLFALGKMVDPGAANTCYEELEYLFWRYRKYVQRCFECKFVLVRWCASPC